jgi:SPP1 family predicted phage head-tail adaptor
MNVRLDTPITIQSKTVTVDSGGGALETWMDDLVVWAGKADQGGREFRAAGMMLAETTTVFTIRYMDGLTSENRIRSGSRSYDIVAISEVGRRQWLLVQTKLSQNQ